MLFIIATPIGNLKDITLRALETLKQVDGIICEDTRHTSQLLNLYNIKKPLTALNDFNENKIFLNLVERLKNGENLGLVSDAGTPLISDPGYKLIRESLKLGIPVDSIPGAVSPIVALTLSALPPDKFMFLGYLPEKPGARQKVYDSLKEINTKIPTTFIFFLAPFKLQKPLAEIKEYFGDINICLAKELTKIHQSVQTKKISTWLNEFKTQPPKGEYIILLNLNANE